MCASESTPPTNVPMECETHMLDAGDTDECAPEDSEHVPSAMEAATEILQGL